MQPMLIRVNVAQGIFSSEKAVSFEADGKQYSLIVDEDDLQGDKLRVYVVARHEGEALIDLPRDTFTSGNRIRVPESLLLPA